MARKFKALGDSWIQRARTSLGLLALGIGYAPSVLAQLPPPPPAAPPLPPPAAAPVQSKPDAKVQGSGAAGIDTGAAASDVFSARDAEESEDEEAPAASVKPEAKPAAQKPTKQAPRDAAAADSEEAVGEAETDGVSETDDATTKRRKEQSRTQVSLWGSTGLLRTHYAASAPVGTFRFGLLSSYFGSTGFLCPQCEAEDGGPPWEKDHVRRVEAHVQVSATPLPYLEAYVAIHSSATSNDRGNPKLLQVLGDTSWGVKGFMPYAENQVFTAGGAVEAWFLNGTGGVGVDGTSFALRGLATVDLTNRTRVAERIPLRINANLNYIFDNSGNLVAGVEQERQHPISRIERFGLNINRIDRLVLALGAEGMFEVVRPFYEFSIDVPSNRQGYGCVRRKLGASDTCMSDYQSVKAVPSRMSIGARAFGLVDGFNIFGALDVGLGGVGALFWEEAQPEAPWNFWFGLAYSADTKPRVRVRTIEKEAPRVALAESSGVSASGVVVDEATGAPIASAMLKFEGRALTGMVTNDSGKFTTAPLPPGQYTLSVSADDYDAASCSLSVVAPEAAPAAAVIAPTPGGAGAVPPPPMPASPAAPEKTGGPRCELKAKPRVGNIEGTIIDAVSLRPLTRALVTVTDTLGRSLSLEVDERGAFRFENVPPGKITLRVEGENYLPTATFITVLSRKDVDLQIPAFARPAAPSCAVAGNELRCKRAIRFADDSADVLPETRSLVDELASHLAAHPELASVEIQVHVTTGALPETNLKLSTERANALREALIARGIDAVRLRAQGFGDAKRLVPGDTEASRARNDRVVLSIGK